MLCALIMAGGTGKRFWPLSTDEHPKQLLKLFSDKSMLRETVERILPLIPIENIYIATNIVQADAINQEIPMLPKENLIIEPAFKDTAAAIGFSSLYIQRRQHDATLVVLASDHLVMDEEAFIETVKIGASEAEYNRDIITLGIRPTRPEIGYGYIKVDQDIELKKIYKVEKFLEKPKLEQAKEYFEAKTYLWNSGMFIFSVKTIMREIKKHMPKHYRVLKNIQFYIDQNLSGTLLAEKTRLLFDDFERLSIDYGVMEKSSHVKVIPSEFGWNDVGSFTAYEDVYDKDEENNIVLKSDFKSVDSHGNIVLTDNLEIKAVGLKDMIVVQSGDKLLICNKYEIDKMKKIL
jgi:mannose-1-phosphate guanylyltransferase